MRKYVNVRYNNAGGKMPQHLYDIILLRIFMKLVADSYTDPFIPNVEVTLYLFV